MVAVRVRRLVFLVCMDEILKHAVYSSIFAVVIVSRHAVYSSKDRNTQRNQVIFCMGTMGPGTGLNCNAQWRYSW